MNIGFASAGRVMWRIRLLAGLLAAVGQIGWSGAALTLARDESSAVSHAEQSGVDLHHGHNEATCAACIALSFHAPAGTASPPVPLAALAQLRPVRAAHAVAVAHQLLLHSPRAPPRET
jgi:hypothetical protein